MDTVLQMENITKRFPGVVALQKMSLQLEAGSIMALIGENGAGKSTLIKILSGAYQPDSGTITINGETCTSMTPAKSISSGISVIYQELNLVPQLAVYENIFLGKESTNGIVLNKSDMIARSTEILESLGLSISPTTLVKHLSVSYQQMVEVAKAIAHNAKVLVLDEPTSSLSNAEVARLFGILRKLQLRGVSMIYISHRLEEVFEICDSITVMRDGEFVSRKKIEEVSRKDLVRMMVGRELSETFPPKKNSGSDEIVLEVKGLSGGRVQNVDFALHRGEILGFAGLVGAGRTEIVQLLFGAEAQKSGTVALNGKPASIRHPIDAISAGLGLVPEDRKKQGLVLKASIGDNISLASLDKLKSALWLSKKKEKAQAEHYVDAMSIKTPSISKITLELSGGNQQKVVLSKWLASECTVFILDEPTRGIDVRSKYDIYQLMRSLTEQGISIIMVSSEMPELLGMADRIAVIRDYRIVDILDREEFSQERILNSASGGAGNEA